MRITNLSSNKETIQMVGELKLRDDDLVMSNIIPNQELD